MTESPSFYPLHRLESARGARIETAGRLSRHADAWHLENAHVSRPLSLEPDLEPDPREEALVHLSGDWQGDVLVVEAWESLHRPQSPSTCHDTADALSLGEVARASHRARQSLRSVFEARDFLEVTTPHAVESPGTDLYLNPVGTRPLEGRDRAFVAPYLHTSPEFAMKRLLSEGLERIYQLATVWRDGEMTDWHHPEFTMLEWYRAWEGLERAMTDVETLVEAVLGSSASIASSHEAGTTETSVTIDPPFERIAMRDLVQQVCGFDLLEALDYDDLWRACADCDLLPGRFEVRHPRGEGRWDDLFFELMVTQIEPALADRGAVFVTEWPEPLAILARRHPDDRRVAERFELYIGGIEIANGFRELTDPEEQRRRFEDEIATRRELGMPELPMPETFLEALEYGLPPSSGVALGVDRLLMLELGASTIGTLHPTADRSEAP